MASEEDHIPVYNEEDDDDEDDEPLKDVVLDDDEDAEEEDAGDRSVDAGDSDDSDETNSTSSAAFAAVPLSSASAVSIVALPPSSTAPVNGSGSPAGMDAVGGGATTSAVVSTPTPSVFAAEAASGERKLFQKLWTDEDEIELLRGFLEYNSQRGPNWSGHHHDTTAFYDRIKSRIQLDCNKNQLVEKLRRLKKKYRTVISRISSGKEFVLKSPHDQTLFEISGKIWGNSIANRAELDDDDRNPNPTATSVVPNYHSMGGDQRASGGFSMDINSPDHMMMMNMGTPNTSRKRSRLQVEEKVSRNPNSGGFEAVNPVPVQAPPEETMRSGLAPILKDFIGNLRSEIDFGSGNGGSKGIGSLVSNAVPMNFTGVSLCNRGDVMDEKWRKQMILELEVYSKRLELVQDQIKLSLEELRSRGR